jgi:Superfamily I DNA and RNA helicases
MKNIDYYKNLNDSQKKAVEYLDGPLLIVAGAGSGKTRVLTTKICPYY